MAEAPSIRVSWVHSPAPREVVEGVLVLPPGATVAQALEACGLLEGEARGELAFSIWGRAVQRDQVLRDGDRLEATRALVVDPKVARRERFARQGARATGLFSKKRPGAKAGY